MIRAMRRLLDRLLPRNPAVAIANELERRRAAIARAQARREVDEVRERRRASGNPLIDQWTGTRR